MREKEYMQILTSYLHRFIMKEKFLEQLMLFSQTAASDRLEAGIVIFFVALPLVIALTNMVLDHIRKTQKNPKLSFVYRWQHSKFRMVLVKTILKR